MKRAFTLVELLTTIVIITILAGVSLAALQGARESARESATRATIAKLHNIIMARYESYMNLRVNTQLPATIAALSPADPVRIAFEAKWQRPYDRTDDTGAAKKKLDAIRDLIRMEMPDCREDITTGPVQFAWGYVQEPPLHRLYATNPPTSGSGLYDMAQCLYKIVSMGSPEAMEQFSQSEIGTTTDGHPVFVDGWGMPICFLRWAPGFRSELQSGDATRDHDSLDTRNIDASAFRLVPLIYSGGSDRTLGLQTGISATFMSEKTPYGSGLASLGSPTGTDEHDNITNHSL